MHICGLRGPKLPNSFRRLYDILHNRDSTSLHCATVDRRFIQGRTRHDTVVEGAELSAIIAVSAALIANPKTGLEEALELGGDIAVRGVYVFVVLLATFTVNILLT